MLHTLAVLPALQLSAATYDTGAILFRGKGRNIYRAGDFYDVVISPTGDSVSKRGDIWRGANLLRDTGFWDRDTLIIHFSIRIYAAGRLYVATGGFDSRPTHAERYINVVGRCKRRAIERATEP